MTRGLFWEERRRRVPQNELVQMVEHPQLFDSIAIMLNDRPEKLVCFSSI
jgi:hypothetical protein